MLQHIAAYNAVFATIQLLIAAGFFVRRTLKPALAASIVWALFVWWFGESLGGILTGSSPLAGLPGGVVLYALIAVLLWPTPRAPARSAGFPGPVRAPWSHRPEPAVARAVGQLQCYLLLPGKPVTSRDRPGLRSYRRPAWLAYRRHE